MTLNKHEMMIRMILKDSIMFSTKTYSSTQNLALSLLGNDDSTCGLCQSVGSLDENAVEQWDEFLDSACLI